MGAVDNDLLPVSENFDFSSGAFQAPFFGGPIGRVKKR